MNRAETGWVIEIRPRTRNWRHRRVRVRGRFNATPAPVRHLSWEVTLAGGAAVWVNGTQVTEARIYRARVLVMQVGQQPARWPERPRG